MNKNLVKCFVFGIFLFVLVLFFSGGVEAYGSEGGNGQGTCFSSPDNSGEIDVDMYIKQSNNNAGEEYIPPEWLPWPKPAFPPGWKHIDGEIGRTTLVPIEWKHQPGGRGWTYYVPPTYKHISGDDHKYFPATSYRPPTWKHIGHPETPLAITMYVPPNWQHDDHSGTGHTRYYPPHYTHLNKGPMKTMYYDPLIQKHATKGPQRTSLVPEHYFHVIAGKEKTKYVPKTKHLGPGRLSDGTDSNTLRDRPYNFQHTEFPIEDRTWWKPGYLVHIDGGPQDTWLMPLQNIHVDKEGPMKTMWVPQNWVHDNSGGVAHTSYINPCTPTPPQP